MHKHDGCTTHCTLTLQLVLVFDMDLPADQRVPQSHRPMEHLSPSAGLQRYAVEVGCLDCVQPGPSSCFVPLALASWEVDGVFGYVEACHDCTSTTVHNWVAKSWLNLHADVKHLRQVVGLEWSGVLLKVTAYTVCSM